MRRACIDIGSNTTRLLVAECDGERLHEVHQERVFTRIGRGLAPDGELRQDKIAEVAGVVGAQLRSARDLGASEVRGVATAAVRQAANREVLLSAVRSTCGLEIEILSAQEEARLAFVGVAGTLGHLPRGELGVVDVGGGSSELVVGSAPDQISWCRSFALGSGELADDYLRSDPPSTAELGAARARVAAVLGGLEPPQPAEVVAVGGSATSLCALAGSLLDADALTRSLRLLASERAAQIARRFGLELERVRLLPAGLLILQAASEALGGALSVGRGGIREGILLETGTP